VENEWKRPKPIAIPNSNKMFNKWKQSQAKLTFFAVVKLRETWLTERFFNGCAWVG